MFFLRCLSAISLLILDTIRSDYRLSIFRNELFSRKVSTAMILQKICHAALRMALAALSSRERVMTAIPTIDAS